MNKFKVKLKEIKLFGHHGVLPEEQEKGQDFYVDLSFGYQKEDPDEIESAIDYAAVYALVKQTFEDKRYNLLENLCQDIAKAIIEQFAIAKVKVSVSKINPPVGGEVQRVSVSTTCHSE